MKATLNKIKNGAMESTLGLQGAATRDFSKKMLSKAMERCFGLMGIFIGGGGKMEFSMVRANCLSARRD